MSASQKIWPSLITLSFLALLTPAMAIAAWRIVYVDKSGATRTVYAETGRVELDDTVFRQGFEP